MRFYHIAHQRERDENGRALRWNNEYGWVTLGVETVFTQEERRSMSLPTQGFWQEAE